MSTAIVEVDITPAMMAEAFWDMGSTSQIQFFLELAKVIKKDHETDSSAYGLGELQWHFLEHDLRHKSLAPAREVLMAIGAPFFLHTLKFAESPP